MKNLGQIVGYAGLLLESIIVVRSIQCKSFAKYPVFYTYIVSVLCADLFLLVAYAIATPSARLFWRFEIVTVALGCGVLLEISRYVFARHISLDHFVRWTTVLTFGSIFFVFTIHAFFLPNWNPVTNSAELERQLRVAQALALMSIVFVSGYYEIAIGRNMKGMILGFGVYVAATLMSLTLLQMIGIRFIPAWMFIQPFSYVVALLIWTVALWTYEADTVTTLRF
jgi:hypothetical protein